MNKDLQRVIDLLSMELEKNKDKIARIDRILPECDRLNREYWRDARAQAVAFLNV